MAYQTKQKLTVQEVGVLNNMKEVERFVNLLIEERFFCCYSVMCE